MKKILKVILIIFSLIIIVAGAITIWQYDNIKALIIGLQKPTEDIAAELDNNREELKIKVEKYINKQINDITAEDEEKLLKGEMSVEEVAEKYDLPLDYMTDKTENNDENDYNVIKENKEGNETLPNNQTGNSNVSQNDSDNSKKIDEAVSVGVSKMYALKAKYVSKLGELEREIYKQYTSLPKDKQDEENKKSLVVEYIDDVADWEKFCDEEVSAVLISLENELKNLDGDTEIIKILQDAYENEKELKKSYYLSLYNN